MLPHEDNDLIKLVANIITTSSSGEITTADSNVVAEAANLLSKIRMSKESLEEKIKNDCTGLLKHMNYLGSTKMLPILENLRNAFKINSYLLTFPPLTLRSTNLLHAEVSILTKEILFSDFSDSIADKEESAERVLAIVGVLSKLDASRFSNREKDILKVSISRFLRLCSNIPDFRVDTTAASNFVANLSKSVDDVLLLKVLG